ncbi:hypothetical protein PHYBLDRAFT_68093 [Phycomyces blakesleeanus NRRL 1555(-)]|uniref:Uncharacterized protein n=1 Tax=Phycomyces blakesleeanus (strain ATCC 8743b / DSM 1359 / FGSC 10004 / NBRC 33097 / NRRL 1555) TaxID=763407 RepID=A0A167P203_PHYB8|nr:hypothetical protein PHYBLDRAFT_68093 [Phycomyces blakesleeanus NRRL 1555(-)]OAD77096.1 hypothetical protein PHYBLDRAFT_68093 [Phycomyces blakesleeanus NRRL 1555(-)]|eukprot:XP_018295136.1 hypothetical protein PHYBLDRAFT_68093 [Phycomyces blakesleeanus NRRL 1555(-)]
MYDYHIRLGCLQIAPEYEYTNHCFQDPRQLWKRVMVPIAIIIVIVYATMVFISSIAFPYTRIKIKPRMLFSWNFTPLKAQELTMFTKCLKYGSNSIYPKSTTVDSSRLMGDFLSLLSLFQINYHSLHKAQTGSVHRNLLTFLGNYFSGGLYLTKRCLSCAKSYNRGFLHR